MAKGCAGSTQLRRAKPRQRTYPGAAAGLSALTPSFPIPFPHLDRRQPVRDDNGGAPDHEVVQRLLHQALALCVERTGGLCAGT
eukprot:353939-Chlamydomonas_euryale.AAC.37